MQTVTRFLFTEERNAENFEFVTPNLSGTLSYGAENWHGDVFPYGGGLCRGKNRKKSLVSGKNRTYCRLPYKKDIFQHHSL